MKTKMTDIHWAAMSTTAIVLSIWTLAALIIHTLGAISSVAAIAGFLIALAWLPSTWRFCYREVRNRSD